MKVRVVYSSWGADGFDKPLGGGEHVLEDVTEVQARSIAGAEAGGAVEVVEATAAERKLLEPHVQSQEDAEAAREAAQDVHDEAGNVVERGDWQHGNLLDFIAVKKDKLLHDDRIAVGDAEGEPLGDDGRAAIERQIAQAEETLEGIEAPQ